MTHRSTRSRRLATAWRPWTSLGAAVVLALSATDARADGTTADLAASDSHVREARRLLQRGRIAEACAELKLADRDYPRTSVLVELAECYKTWGFTGTAQEVLRRAELRAASEDNTAAGALAARRAGDIEHRFARIRIKIGPSLDPAALDVTLDAQPVVVTRDSVHVVDPELLTSRTHEVVVRARGRKKRTWLIEVSPGSETTIDVDGMTPQRDARVGSAALNLDSASSTPVGGATGSHGVRLAFEAVTGLYDATSPVHGRGAFESFVFRPSVAIDRWTLYVRDSITWAFDIPKTTGLAAVASPELGFSYRLPIGKFALNTGLSVTPPLLSSSPYYKLNFVRSLGAIQGGYGPDAVGIALPLVVELPVAPSLYAVAGVVGQGLFAVRAPADTIAVFTHFVRAGWQFAQKLTVIAGYTSVLVLVPGKDPPIGLAPIGGIAFSPSPTYRFEVNATRTVLNANPSVNPTYMSAGMTVSF